MFSRLAWLNIGNSDTAAATVANHGQHKTNTSGIAASQLLLCCRQLYRSLPELAFITVALSAAVRVLPRSTPMARQTRTYFRDTETRETFRYWIPEAANLGVPWRQRSAVASVPPFPQCALYWCVRKWHRPCVALTTKRRAHHRAPDKGDTLQKFPAMITSSPGASS